MTREVNCVDVIELGMAALTDNCGSIAMGPPCHRFSTPTPLITWVVPLTMLGRSATVSPVMMTGCDTVSWSIMATLKVGVAIEAGVLLNWIVLPELVFCGL